MSDPWNNWYHCMANTYGTWLPGDPRGWRTRKHRRHIEGDYKSPPRENHAPLHRQSQALMKRPPVHLSPAARARAVDLLRLAFERWRVEPLVISVSAMHMHVLARFVPWAAGDVAAWLVEARSRPPAAWDGGERAWIGLRAGQFVRYTKTGRVVADPARHYMGIAKKESSNALIEVYPQYAGGVWADRGKIVPVADRGHQVELVRYIARHKREGAAIWLDPRLIKK